MDRTWWLVVFLGLGTFISVMVGLAIANGTGVCQ